MRISDKIKKSFLFVFCISMIGTARSQQKNLEYFLNIALKKSPLLKEYSKQVEGNLIDSSIIAASYKPQVKASSTNSYAPIINGYGYESAITNIGNFSELISISKQLGGKANLQNQYDAIHLLNDSIKVSARISVQDLKRSITQQYISAFGSWQQYLYNSQVLELLTNEDSILKKLTQQAIYRQTDYLTFLVTLQQQQIAVTESKILFENDYTQLNYLCGLVDTIAEPLPEPDLQLGEILSPEETVYYQKFLVDSLLLKNEHDRINYAYKPKITLYGDAGYVSTLMYLPYKNFGTSFGININFPIYDGGQKKLQHQKVDIAEQTRQFYRDFFDGQYTQQLQLLLKQLHSTDRLIRETSEQLKYIEGLIQANRKLMATGDARIADYVLAINNYLNTKNIITGNTIKRLQIIAQINYWNNP